MSNNLILVKRLDTVDSKLDGYENTDSTLIRYFFILLLSLTFQTIQNPE